MQLTCSNSKRNILFFFFFFQISIQPSNHSLSTNAHSRRYLEEKDHEMDMWIHISKGGSYSSPRILNITATVIKYGCNARSSSFEKCPNSPYCIRKELYCNGLVNCPSGAKRGGMDEANCDPKPSRISTPVAILIIVIVIILLALLFILGAFFYGKFAIRRSPSPYNQCSTNDCQEMSTIKVETRNSVDLPPSYEEATSSNNMS